MRPFPLIRLMGICLLAAMAVAGVGSARAEGKAPIMAVAVAVEAAEAKTRFRITLSKPVTAQTYLMERPDRVIVDLPEVAFHLPPETGRKRQGLIASYRYGLFAPGRSRVVMDLAEPAIVSAISTETGAPGGAAILVIELARAERAEFQRAVAETSGVSKPAPEQPAAKEIQDARPVIVIDPGHGGIDPGAAAHTGVAEKDLVLDFARLLKERLDAQGRYRVLLTRDTDVFVSLGDRVRAARSAKADLFISIHADSISGEQNVRGLTVYTGSERASDADSARLADRENRSDAAAGVESVETPDEIMDILQELTLRETRTFSHGFAARLVAELDSVARLNKNPRREAGFRVLRAHDVPSVLVELGYLSSRQDLDLLMSDEWRGKMVAAMSVAIDRFFATRLARQGAAAVLP